MPRAPGGLLLVLFLSLVLVGWVDSMGCHKVSGPLNGQAVGIVGAVGSFGFGITSRVIPIRL